MLKTPMLTMNTSPPRTMKIPMKKPVPSSGVAMVVGSFGESGQVALVCGYHADMGKQHFTIFK